MNLKRKILFTIRILLLLSYLLVFNQLLFCLGEIRVTTWCGYSTVAMDDVNKQLEMKANYMFEKSGGFSPSIKKFSNGLILGVDVLYKISTDIYLGPRIAFLFSSGEVSGKTTVWGYTQLHPPYDPVFGAKIIVNTFFMPIMFGISYSKEVKKHIFFGSKLFSGYGKANVTSHFEWYKESGYQESTCVDLYGEGIGFMFESSIFGEYRFSSNFSAVIELGYKIAKISSIKQTNEIFYVGKTEEIVIKFEDDQGNKIPFDFSGINFTLGLKYRF